jgi:hypothetical protein
MIVGFPTREFGDLKSMKIKIFMWLTEEKAIQTKDNMSRRNWKGDPACYFCGAPESCDHLMLTCPIAKVI